MRDKARRKPSPHPEEQPSALVDPFLLAAAEERGIKLADIPLERLALSPAVESALWVEGITSLEDLAIYRGGFTKTSYFQRWSDALCELRAELDCFLISLLDSTDQDFKLAAYPLPDVLRQQGREMPKLTSENVPPLAADASIDDPQLPQEEPRAIERGHTRPAPTKAPSDDISLDVLGLSRRAYNCLRREGLHTVGEIATLTDEQFLSIRNLGITTLSEIREKLAAYLAQHSLPEQYQPPEPSHLEPLPASQVSVPDNTPIEVLGLSIRPHNALTRSGIVTIGRLAQMSSEQILRVRNVGKKALGEIEEKLETYLAEHPLMPPGPSAPVEPEPPLVDPALLARAAQIPLDNISVERLVLPVRWRDQLRHRGIESVGELVRQPSCAFGQDSPVREQLERYLAWLVEQDEATWADELAGRGISPMHRLMLAETTLDDLAEQWLGILSERERQVLQWRYGRDGETLTLEEAAQRLGLTRERIRQLQAKALRHISTPKAESLMRPLVESLRQTFVEAGGLMTEAEVGESISGLVRVEITDPEWVGRLILHTCEEFERVTKGYLWGLADAPLHLARDINGRLISLLERAHVPLVSDELLAEFRRTRFYNRHHAELPNDFLCACLRTNQAIEIVDDQCSLIKWTRSRTHQVILALQAIGRPAHYKVIAERTNALLPPDQRTSSRTICAYMDRRTDIFVGLGRGVYWLREHVAGGMTTQLQADFGDLFGSQLARWQAELDRRSNSVDYNTHAEVDTIRDVGLDFFAK